MSGSYHLGITPSHLEGNSGLGRYVFLPGDRGRAQRIAERFEVTERVMSSRGHDSHLGVLRSADGSRSVDVLSVSSGMGPPSVEIVLHELLLAGARRIVRVGSSGSLAEGVVPGSVVIATSSVRDESTSDRWTPREFPAVAHRHAIAALCRGAEDAELADHTFAGVVHSKNSFYAREFGAGPMAQENERYIRVLRDSGVLASEMEASILFVMASVAGAGRAESIAAGSRAAAVQTGCVLAVYGEQGSAETKLSEQRAITVACAGVLAWAGIDKTTS